MFSYAGPGRLVAKTMSASNIPVAFSGFALRYKEPGTSGPRGCSRPTKLDDAEEGWRVATGVSAGPRHTVMGAQAVIRCGKPGRRPRRESTGNRHYQRGCPLQPPTLPVAAREGRKVRGSDAPSPPVERHHWITSRSATGTGAAPAPASFAGGAAPSVSQPEAASVLGEFSRIVLPSPPDPERGYVPMWR
jgi:hypothetical protein